MSASRRISVDLALTILNGEYQPLDPPHAGNGLDYVEQIYLRDRCVAGYVVHATDCLSEYRTVSRIMNKLELKGRKLRKLQAS